MMIMFIWSGYFEYYACRAAPRSRGSPGRATRLIGSRSGSKNRDRLIDLTVRVTASILLDYLSDSNLKRGSLI
jgi:hypothetical protein